MNFLNKQTVSGWHKGHAFGKGYFLERPGFPKHRIYGGHELLCLSEDKLISLLCKQVWHNAFIIKKYKRNPIKLDFTNFKIPLIKTDKLMNINNLMRDNPMSEYVGKFFKHKDTKYDSKP